MDTPSPITHIGLCAGYGGIELGLHRVIRNLRSVALCEIEAFACANLVAKMEAGLMDCAPIWTNLKTFPWAEFRDRVDILTGGYPCQPFSAAGKRLGAEDPRHLWPFIADGIRLLQPRMCFFENVEGHISLGLSTVISDLEELGYKVSWGIFSASVDAGAPHQRKRVFILAYRHGERGQLPDWWRVTAEQVPVGYGETWRDAWPSRPGEPQHAWEPPRVVGNARSQESHRLPSGRGREEVAEVGQPSAMGNAAPAERWPDNLGSRGQADETAGAFAASSHAMGNPSERKDNGRESRDLGQTAGEGRCGDHAADGAGESAGLADDGIQRGDGRADRTGRRVGQSRETGEDVAGIRSEGDGLRQTQPALGRDADGRARGLGYAELCVSCDNRTDELRLLGNGVVPATAERAFRTLWEELLK